MLSNYKFGKDTFGLENMKTKGIITKYKIRLILEILKTSENKV